MISIDSCKIRIPLEFCQVLNDSLNSYWLPMEMNQNTGELREGNGDAKGKAYYLKENGIPSRFVIEKQVTRDKKVICEYLTMFINSKMLKERYFEGITRSNLKVVYDYIISRQVVSFSYQAFKDSQCTDVDYKKDFQCDDRIALVSRLELITIPKKKKGEGHLPFKQPGKNIGIEFSDRKTTAIKSAPYIKIYAKDIELKQKSFEFEQLYIPGDITGKTRVEFTIKNKAHFRIYEVEDTSLFNLTNINQETLETMLKQSLSKHITKSTRVKKDGDSISNQEQEIINLVNIARAHKIGVNEMKVYLYGNLTRKIKKRRSEFFDVVWQKHFSKFSLNEQATDMEIWLKSVGVEFL